MRNSFGVLNIYFRALWMPLLFILGPLALGGVMTWAALFHTGWLTVVGALILGPASGFAIYCFWDTGWDVWRDIFGGRITLRGRINRKWVTERKEQGATFKDYEIAVNRHSFEVSKKIYNWLSSGDAVVVYYWPRSKTVARVEKLTVQDVEQS